MEILNTIISLLGLTVVGLALGYMVALVVNLIGSNVKVNQLHEAEREVLRQRAQKLAEPLTMLEERGSSEAAWAGYRKFVLAGKVLEAENICSFYYAPHDGRQLPPYLPGQYLTFRLHVPGQANPVTRCYSLSDSPNHPDYYRITVKRILPPPDKSDLPPGLASSFLHHELQPDDIVDVKAPSGHFYLDTAHHHPVVLIAGGIGLTPVLSMLNYIAESGSTRETWFFYGVRNSSEHAMKDHLQDLANENENIHLRICYSDPLPEDEEGRDFDHAERVSVELLKNTLESNNYDFYICGPPPMMNAMVEDLDAWGVPRDKIHYEAFGPASVKRVSTVSEGASASGVQVTFARSGKTLAWGGDAGSLLEFAEANGIPMDCGCRAGNCGTCLTAIREGEVEYLNEPGAPVEEGSCLTCISVPKSNVSLDA